MYTSNNFIDFPGRKFKIVQTIPYSKKEMKKLGITKANITIRNFSDSVAGIRNKYKIKDGGEIYLFFTKNIDDEFIVLKCEKA